MSDPRSENPKTDKLDSIVAEYLQAEREGRAPDREALISEHPELQADLRSFFKSHDEVAGIVSPLLPGSEGKAVPQAGFPTRFVGEHGGPPETDEEATVDTALSPGARLRYFGDYELLEEIARGGMGVVYKARQTRLNRIVAVKMILAGQLASPEDVQRFHVEAEAAAGLDHPNIVPIYEVGEHKGQHYFSMSFVEGQSLVEKLQDGPLSSGDAADLTRKIAEAIAYAHQRGVIHRDLKPANILLDGTAEPQITDFGLAKRVEDPSGLTATGQVLGTPSYMPPEQVRGEIAEISPASDVYALGAILYHALTGRPPFLADSVVDTLFQVLEHEPVYPRQLDPTIPRDLETICLKCLNKAPGERYASARELVEELERFLKGERILTNRRRYLVHSRIWGLVWVLCGMIAGAGIATVLGNQSVLLFGAIGGGVLAGLGLDWNLVLVPLWLLRRTRNPLAKVSLGLGLMLSSLAFRGVPGVPRSLGYSLEDFGVLPDLLATAGALLGILGPVLCLAVPARSRAQGVLYGAVALHVASVIIGLTHDLTLKTAGSTTLDPVGAGLDMASLLLLVVFLGRLARFLDRPELAARARQLLILIAICACLVLGGLFAARAFHPLMLLCLVAVAPAFWLYYSVIRRLQLAILEGL
jgi:tRNA A-37 threonylcarbamoyl transferase component Bud32